MLNKDIQKILDKYNLGNLSNIELLKSHQNKVYKVITDKGIYVVKEYSKDAIGSYSYLKIRKEQIRISEILKKNNINTIIPITYRRRKFMLYNKHYYLIYNYSDGKVKDKKDITIDNIKMLALTQSKIHKLNINSSLKCSYRYINIDIDKQLSMLSKINKDLYNKLNDNKEILNTIISNCNKYIENMYSNLCVSHNDYKLLNVLWENEKIVLIDFDAVGLSNPTCSLCESAFTFSNYDNYIKYDYYEEYLKTYIDEYGLIDEDYNEALYVSFNGKLQWLDYMFSKNHLEKDNYIMDSINMINELVLYYNNIEKFNDIYRGIINK